MSLQKGNVDLLTWFLRVGSYLETESLQRRLSLNEGIMGVPKASVTGVFIRRGNVVTDAGKEKALWGRR